MKIFFRILLVVLFVILYSNLIGILLTGQKETKKIEMFINDKVPDYNVNKNKDEYFMAVLEIPKIKLKKGLYDTASPNNTVEKNIEVNKKSNMPDIKNGNFILASHSGLSIKAYFNELEKLNKGDDVIVYYKKIKYNYKIFDFYDIEKTGKAAIKRDYNKNTITLITCKKKESKQIVYIGYLYMKSKY